MITTDDNVIGGEILNTEDINLKYLGVHGMEQLP